MADKTSEETVADLMASVWWSYRKQLTEKMERKLGLHTTPPEDRTSKQKTNLEALYAYYAEEAKYCGECGKPYDD